MAINLATVRARLSSLQTQTTKQDLLWKPSQGKSQIRIVPYKFNKDNPFIELLFHFNLGGKTYLSPATFGRPDPIMEFAEKLKRSGDKNDYKMAKSLEPKLRTFAPILVRGEEDKGVKFWGFGKTVYQELLNIISDPDYGDITDPAHGRDIVVEFKSAEETGKSFPTTTIRVKPNQSMLVETGEAFQEMLNSQKDILEIYKEFTYEELKTVLTNWLKGDKQPATEEPSSKKPKFVVEDDDAQEVKKATPVAKSANVSTASNIEDIGKKFDELFNTDN